MQYIVDSDLQYIIDKMENIINNMQRNITSYNEQKTKLYWTHIKMSNNMKIWNKDIEAIQQLNNLLDNMLLYTEKIIKLAENILSDIKKVRQDINQGNIEKQEECISILEQKVYILSVFYKNYNEEQANYVNYIEVVKQMLDKHKVKNISFWQKIKCKFM